VLSELSLSTGEVHPIVDVHGTRTSRIIVRNPALQNLSKRFRSIIQAAPGKALAYADFDQFEVGIMAALSGDERLIALFNSADMYDSFAKQYLKMTDFRKPAKQLFLSYAYGMPRKAVVDAAVSLGAERSNAKSAFAQFSRYEAWKKDKERQYEHDGKMPTLLGNYIVADAPLPLGKPEMRSMISQCVQGTGSLIFKKAVLKLSSLPDCRILLPMHDAFLFEHSDKKTPQAVVEFMKQAMTETLEGKVVGKASLAVFAA
jgi:DNA polymerase I-like protein with 3'-5' exonuclease and polymerase domains